MAQILSNNSRELDLLASYLAEGNVAAVPTETVYGLAGNALDPSAVERIFKLKGRPSTNPLIVHVEHLDELDALATLPNGLDALLSKHWPGPLTLILPKKPCVPDSVTAGLNSVAVRMPAHPVFRALKSRCRFPIAAPSANPFGYISPTLAEHVQNTMGDRLDYILDGGPCSSGLESTILSLLDPRRPTILRNGTLTAEELQPCLEAPILVQREVQSVETAQTAPGQLKKHYSPNTPLLLFTGTPPEISAQEVRVFLTTPAQADSQTFGLSQQGDLREVAQSLYRTLNHLDKAGYQRIFLEVPSGQSQLALAIRDRMERAAAQ